MGMETAGEGRVSRLQLLSREGNAVESSFIAIFAVIAIFVVIASKVIIMRLGRWLLELL